MKKILIANRGEIALRVIRTCRAMGIKTVTIYTPEEKDLPHASMGDESINLGHGPLSDTYLNIDKIVSLCQKLGVDAVHPGYGFLSERSAFAKALSSAGVKLIGPPVKAMEAMGDKKTSKVMMEEAGVPLIPGYHGDNQDPVFLQEQACEVGFPILVKASAGGGGKGMRIVNKEEDFIEALSGAQSEAMNAFGDDKVLIEKYITEPRHIEVQVMSDEHGKHLHFFERECSIQRRYQKIIEESPSPALSEEQRQAICTSAVKISEFMNYVGAGTVEFILDTDGQHYFLEMNTRLQVEHPITEMVTGVDLVQLQIEVAQGIALDIDQEDIEQRGHAIECRLYAEDPDQGFLPSIGKIKVVGSPTLSDVRLDTGYVDGNEVTISFDPMLAKLITYEGDRESCIEKMKLSLADIPFLGVQTNREYLGRILGHESFIRGETYTHFVQTYADSLCPEPLSAFDKALAIAAFFSDDTEAGQDEKYRVQNNPWDQVRNFRNV
jgi:acetyl/propionyl-CoA carboxylase alpha subunit